VLSECKLLFAPVSAGVVNSSFFFCYLLFAARRFGDVQASDFGKCRSKTRFLESPWIF
jgi:hypothetical protein